MSKQIDFTYNTVIQIQFKHSKSLEFKIRARHRAENTNNTEKLDNIIEALRKVSENYGLGYLLRTVNH